MVKVVSDSARKAAHNLIKFWSICPELEGYTALQFTDLTQLPENLQQWIEEVILLVTPFNPVNDNFWHFEDPYGKIDQLKDLIGDINKEFSRLTKPRFSHGSQNLVHLAILQILLDCIYQEIVSLTYIILEIERQHQGDYIKGCLERWENSRYEGDDEDE
jgi:hypothetical protein